MNMRNKKKTANFLTAAAFSLTAMTAPFGALMQGTTVYADNVLSVEEIAEDMGIGWNLGNSLDSHGSGYRDSITSYETYWGNPVVTRELISAVKAKGFDTVRVPVTWYEHLSNDGNYTIDPNWLARVKEVVDYAYSQDMYVILNIHHEAWINRKDFPDAGDSMETQLRAVWTQIADYFSDYGQRLIFEGMNEPRAVGSLVNEWFGNSSCYEVVNKLNKAFVETVRSVDSPYKSTRMLMIPSYAASSDSQVYSSLTIPKVSGSIDTDNDGDDDYVAVSIHAYSPYNFTMGDGDHSYFSATYRSELASILSSLNSTFIQNGVQVVLGEFGASNYGYEQARLDWAEFYMKTATEYGIPCVLWDNNVEGNGGGEAHGYINRSSNTWYSASESVVNKLISTRDNTDWRSSASYPLKKHADYRTGSSVPISSDGTGVLVGDVSGFVSGKEIAIKYNNSGIPALALMNSGWGGWTEMAPYDYDPQNKVAYVSYDQIAESWDSSENGAVYCIKVTNASTLGLSGAYMIDIPEETEEGVKITGQPENVTAEAGSAASFSVTASGEGLTYQWQVSKNGGTTWANTSTKAAAYKLSSVKTTYNGYQYRCVVTDANGNSVTSNAATLTVTASASLNITSQPANVTVEAGSAASFTVKAEGTGLTYLWQVSKNNGSTWANTSTRTATYKLSSAKAAYNGYQYRCIVKDSSGNSVTSNAATLNVTASLSITSQPANVTANAGSAASFTVKAEGTGLTYLWQVSKNNGVTWTNTSTRAATYALASVKSTYNGYQYRCIVKDSSGNSVTSNAATLNVTASASLSITSQPANVTASVGSAASFSVNAAGDGLKYLWQVSKDGGTTWSNTSTRAAAYKLGSVKASYNGYMYRCVVTDSSGNTVTSEAALLIII